MAVYLIVPLPKATRGSSYSAQLGASGGVSPYSFSSNQEQGQTGLPAGLSCSSTGLISGTVATSNIAGLYTCGINAFDHNGSPGYIVAEIDVI